MTKASKLGKVVTYNKEFPSIKSKDSLITWFCKIT